jgi:hypothetical protein
MSSILFAHLVVDVGRGGPQGDPADEVLHERARLVEIVVLHHHEIGVVLQRAAGERPDDLDLPRARTVVLEEGVARDRDLVADPPTPFGQHPLADERAGALADEGLACARLIDEVAVVEPHVAVRLDREDGEEILCVLVVAAEPGEMGRLAHAVGGSEPVEVRHRQLLGHVDLVHHDQAVHRSIVLAGIEPALERGEHAEDGERHQD